MSDGARCVRQYQFRDLVMCGVMYMPCTIIDQEQWHGGKCPFDGDTTRAAEGVYEYTHLKQDDVLRAMANREIVISSEYVKAVPDENGAVPIHIKEIDMPETLPEAPPEFDDLSDLIRIPYRKSVTVPLAERLTLASDDIGARYCLSHRLITAGVRIVHDGWEYTDIGIGTLHEYPTALDLTLTSRRIGEYLLSPGTGIGVVSFTRRTPIPNERGR
jgi:hypothetical protein